MYQARVVARQGNSYIVKDNSGNQIHCHARSNAVDAVCGDHVNCLPQSQSHDVIESIQPRKNQITRIDNFKREKTLAANIDHMLIVVAALPAFTYLLIDKYLACAQLNQCKSSIIINKAEYLADNDVNIDDIQSIYESITNNLIFTSAKLGYGINHTRKILRNESSVLVGQSGVGKSSIINGLMRFNQIKVGNLSEGIQQGRHTTTSAYAYSISENGIIIDSPGVRSFTPIFNSREEVAHGFVEFQEIAENCKFANCLHIKEPDCAIKNAASEGSLHPSRYESYCSIIQEQQDKS